MQIEERLNLIRRHINSSRNLLIMRSKKKRINQRRGDFKKFLINLMQKELYESVVNL